MNITSLPEDLNLASHSSMQVFDYFVDNNYQRKKINLTKNTFSFLLEGTKEVITNDKSTIIGNSNFLVIKSGNCLMTETISTTNKTYRSILLFFTDELLLDFLEKNKLNSVPPPAGPSFHVCRYDNYINHYVESLQKINRLNTALQADLLKAKFEEIMIYLTQKEGYAFINSLLKSQDSKTLRLINIVENSKLKKLSLQELSFLCNMSLSTFKRAFYKQYQTAPVKWFQERRLEHSAFLLSTQKKRPIDLYEEAGYENLSNFIQAFKKKYGSTPKQFQLEKMNF